MLPPKKNNPLTNSRTSWIFGIWWDMLKIRNLQTCYSSMGRLVACLTIYRIQACPGNQACQLFNQGVCYLECFLDCKWYLPLSCLGLIFFKLSNYYINLQMVAGIIPIDIDLTIFQGNETTSLAIFAGASSQGCDILFAWPKPGPVSVLCNRSKNTASMLISVPFLGPIQKLKWLAVQEHSDLWSNWKREDLLGSDHGEDAWGAFCEGQVWSRAFCWSVCVFGRISHLARQMPRSSRRRGLLVKMLKMLFDNWRMLLEEALQ